MLAVDTNVVIRFLTADDPEQHRRAVELFRNNPVFLAKTVIVECEWVLRSLYGFSPRKIAEAFRALLALPGVSCEDAQSLSTGIEALDHGLDMADAVHFASGRNAYAFASFDRRFIRRARKLWPSAKLIEA